MKSLGSSRHLSTGNVHFFSFKLSAFVEGWIYIHALILENLMSLIEKAFFSGSGL